MPEDVETRTLSRVAWRFIPFLILCYFVAYLDRVNVGFAKLGMDADLGLSDTAFGFGAGVFFLAYFLFEVPSNIIMDKVGARRWIARIMLSWGIVSAAMAFIPQIAAATGLSAEHTFYGLRILLGFAEAGFFPGIIFFLTLWFPASHRARIVGYFMAAIPLSSAIGSPVSAALFSLDGAWGFRGWQWLFIVEAAPSILLGFVTFFYLTDRPADATWLEPEGRAWLQRRLALEDQRREHVSPRSALASLTDYRVLALSLVYFGAVACLYESGSGCRRSSRDSACRSRWSAGSTRFPMSSASSAWCGGACAPTARASGRCIWRSRWRWPRSVSAARPSSPTRCRR